MKVFAPLASQCEVTLQLFFENFLQDRGSAAKEFQQTLMVYFCSPPWCVLAKSNQLSPAWLCEAVQEGPITPDGGLIAASEWVYSSGCSPRTTTSDRLKSWPLLKQHKASFQGPPCLCSAFPFLPRSHLMESGRVHGINGKQIHVFPE